MAEEKSKKRRIKKPETVRERVEKAAEEPTKRRRVHRATKAASRPIIAARNIGKREYHPIKLPNNTVGRFLTKSRRWSPGFIRNAWAEIRQVTWPTRSETFRMTMAVFIFALVFGATIYGVDYVLERIFKEVIL